VTSARQIELHAAPEVNSTGILEELERKRNEIGERHAAIQEAMKAIREELIALRTERNTTKAQMTHLDKQIKEMKDSRELALHMRRLPVELQATIASFFLYKDDAEKIPKFQHLSGMFPRWKVIHRVRVTGAPDANANGWYTRREQGYPVPSRYAGVHVYATSAGEYLPQLPWYEKDCSDGTFRYIFATDDAGSCTDGVWHINTDEVCLYYMWKYAGDETDFYTPCNDSTLDTWSHHSIGGEIPSISVEEELPPLILPGTKQHRAWLEEQ